MKVSAYLVAMPKTPMIHIQKIAPTPPETTAVATPTMLPVPMVAESAVVSAPNWLTLPSACESFANESLMPVKSLRWMKPVRTVIYRWVPTSTMMSGSPQSQPSTAEITPWIAVIVSITSPSLPKGSKTALLR